MPNSGPGVWDGKWRSQIGVRANDCSQGLEGACDHRDQVAKVDLLQCLGAPVPRPASSLSSTIQPLDPHLTISSQVPGAAVHVQDRNSQIDEACEGVMHENTQSLPPDNASPPKPHTLPNTIPNTLPHATEYATASRCKRAWEQLVAQETLCTLAVRHRKGHVEGNLNCSKHSPIVLAGVCLLCNGVGDVSVIGLLPGAAHSMDIQRGDLVCQLGVVPKCGGEVNMYDLRRMRMQEWPAEILAAAKERNASFRLLTLRYSGNKETMSQVDLARVDFSKLKEDYNDPVCRAKACGAICDAARIGNAHFLRLLLQETRSADLPLDLVATADGEMPLLIASSIGHSKCVRCLLDFKADISTTNADGKAALYFAAVGGHLECLLTLLAGGSRVNASDKYGFRALHGAALHGHSGCVEALVMMGANVNAPIHDGKTAAYLAAMKGHVQCLRVLHKWHGDLTLGDGVLGFSPLQAAVLHGHLPAVMFLSGGECGVACGVACEDAAPAGAEDARKSEEARKSDHPPHARPQNLDDDSLITAACAVSTDAGANGSHGCNGCDASSASCVSTGRSLSRPSALRRLCAREGNWNEDEGEDACCAGDTISFLLSSRPCSEASRASVAGDGMSMKASEGLGGLHREHACRFAALIGMLDAAGGCGGGGQEGCGGGEGHEESVGQAGGVLAVLPWSQRVLKDIGVGYLATCYLASTIFTSSSVLKRATKSAPPVPEQRALEEI